MVSYDRLWTTMAAKNVSQLDLIKAGINPRVLDKLRHNRNVEVFTLVKICDILECDFADIMQNLPEDQIVDKPSATNKGGRKKNTSTEQ